MRVVRDFDAGLAGVERLVEFIESPFLAVLARTLPRHGMKTKPALADPAALLVVGAATVIFGSDRAAERELRYHWEALLPHFAAAGIRVPRKPLSAQNFRDYRDGVMGGAFPEEFMETARDLAAGLAQELGQFGPEDTPWGRPSLSQTAHADGTKFAAASQVGPRHPSRSRSGSPRVVTDADRWAKDAKGYTFCVVVTRGAASRCRVVLDVVHAPRGKEMGVVVPSVVGLKRRLGDGFRCFVYDGAMDGKHHAAMRAAGVMTVNKPRGVRRPDQWRTKRDKVMGAGAILFEVETGCTRRHLLTLAAGMVWDVEQVGGDLVRRRVLDLVDVRRLEDPADGYRWEADLVVRCEHGHHVVTVDPNAPLRGTSVERWRKRPDRPTRTGKAKVNLSRYLRLVQVNDEVSFQAVYGVRNDSEGGNNIIKHFYLLHRAKSFTVERVETDLWLYAVMANTLAWREHCTPTGRAGRRP